MKRRQLFMLIVAGLVLGGLAYMSYIKRQGSFERGAVAEEGQKALAGVPPAAINDVALITVRGGTDEVNLVRGADGWGVKERGGYPANFNNISDTMRKLWDLKVTRAVEVGPSRLPALKLTKADGTQIALKDDKGKEIANLMLGLQPVKESRDDSPFGGGSFPSGRYVMRGDDVKTVALVSDPLNVETQPQDWLNKDWFKVEKVKSIAVKHPQETNSWKLGRESESGEWKLAEPKAGETADSGKTSGLNYLLSSPSFNDVLVDAGPEQLGTNQPVTAVIETFDGFTYTFSLSQLPAQEDYAVKLNVAAHLPKERTPGKDEKPEDKEKLDKEFAESRKKIEEKLKNEQRFEKWAYVVPKWSFENLLKERKDWLAEKKADDEGPSPAPAPAPAPFPPSK